MTNADRVRRMGDDELADWLCKQFWSAYGTGVNSDMDVILYQQVRTFLKMEAEDKPRRYLEEIDYGVDYRKMALELEEADHED